METCHNAARERVFQLQSTRTGRQRTAEPYYFDREFGDRRTRTAEANLNNNTAQSTITSTGTPNIGITKSVFPSQVRTAQNATYTIVVNNTGTAMVTSATVIDQFSTYVDIISVTTTKGTATANASTRRVTVAIGTLSPNEVVTITVVVRVNNTATTNLTVSNSASIDSVFGAATTTRTSNSVSFQLLATATLPGTGGVEPASFLESNPRLGLPALISAVLLGLIGLFALGYGIWARRKGSSGTGWYFKMSGTLLGGLPGLWICCLGDPEFRKAGGDQRPTCGGDGGVYPLRVEARRVWRVMRRW